MGELWDSPLSPRLKVQASAGGEVVAGWGVRMSVRGKKKSALNGDSREEPGAGCERGGGYQERVFLFFFFLWLGEEKKIKIPIPSQHKSMFAPNPASRGRLGQADLKGQRGAERRGEGGEKSQWQ